MFTATELKRSALGGNGRKLVRHDGKQMLVIAQEGRLFAIANRCPHEGYPLSEGTRSGRLCACWSKMWPAERA
jgi:nitrite reductase/ring-hydroxylating ferredoxin subunit